MTYREFYITKKNGSKRRICAPDKELLAEQRRLLPSLEENFRNRSLNHLGSESIFYGFLKNRNCVTAANKHIGYAHTISLDISNCFDSIHLNQIYDSTIRMYEILKAYCVHKDGTLAQGFATSPILANIYLIEPIAKIKRFLESMFQQNFALTVYADDIQISVNQTSYQTLNLITAYVTSVMKTYNLTINPKKTRIHHAKHGNRRILGIQVGEHTIYPNRKLKKKIRAARHQNNGPSLGGLVTASRLLLPKSLRPTTE